MGRIHTRAHARTHRARRGQGGGTAGAGLWGAPRTYSGLNRPVFSHHSYHELSTYLGWYADGIGRVRSARARAPHALSTSRAGAVVGVGTPRTLLLAFKGRVRQVFLSGCLLGRLLRLLLPALPPPPRHATPTTSGKCQARSALGIVLAAYGVGCACRCSGSWGGGRCCHRLLGLLGLKLFQLGLLLRVDLLGRAAAVIHAASTPTVRHTHTHPRATAATRTHARAHARTCPRPHPQQAPPPAPAWACQPSLSR
jgi:hypothetical protein